MRVRVTLAKGEEVCINGFIFRAVGSHKNPDSLQVTHDHRDPLYAGFAEDAICADQMFVGRAEDLANAHTGASETAQQFFIRKLGRPYP